MLIRQSLNFAVHLAAGVAFGALVVVAVCAMRKERHAGETTLVAKQPSTAADAAEA